jgi:hypothetical protein
VPQEKGGDSGNVKSYFNMLSSVISYAGSEWSFAQVKWAEAETQNLSKTIATICKGKVRVIT